MELLTRFSFAPISSRNSLVLSPNSHLIVWWKGTCGHEWKAQIKSRNNGRGCPFCSGRLVLPGFNEIILRSKGLLPLTVDTERSTLRVPAFLKHSQSATSWLLAHVSPGPNPTFDPNNYIIIIYRPLTVDVSVTLLSVFFWRHLNMLQVPCSYFDPPYRSLAIYISCKGKKSVSPCSSCRPLPALHRNVCIRSLCT